MPTDVRSFGTDHTAAQSAINAAVAGDGELYFSAGSDYVFSRGPTVQITHQTINRNLHIYGDGLGSRILLADGNVNSDFDALFSLRNASGSSVELLIEKMYIDHNARGNPFGPGEGSFDWQHSHAFSCNPLGTRGFSKVTFQDLTINDPIADGCNVGGGATNSAGEILAQRITVPLRNRVRSDICITAAYDKLTIRNCDVKAIETEVNSATVDNLGVTIIEDCVTDILDLDFPSAVPVPLNMARLTVNAFVFIVGYKMDWVDSTINLNKPARFVGNGLDNIRHAIRRCKIRAVPPFSGGSFLLYIATAATSPKFMLFEDVEWSKDPLVTQLARYWFDDNTAFDGRVVIFKGQQFKCDPTLTSAIYFRSGEHVLEDVSFSGAIVGPNYVTQGAINGALKNRVMFAPKMGYIPISGTTVKEASVVPVRWIYMNFSDVAGIQAMLTAKHQIFAPGCALSVVKNAGSTKAIIKVKGATLAWLRGDNTAQLDIEALAIQVYDYNDKAALMTLFYSGTW